MTPTTKLRWLCVWYAALGAGNAVCLTIHALNGNPLATVILAWLEVVIGIILATTLSHLVEDEQC